MESDDFRDTLPAKLVPMWKRLLDMAGSVDQTRLGYSLEE